MNTYKKILHLIFGVSILTPFVTTILFVRTDSFILMISLDLISLILLTISTALLTIKYQTKLKYILIAFCSVVVYLSCYGFLLSAADWIFFKTREDRLNELVKNIKKYEKIYEMTDGQRYFKSLNNEPYKNDLDNDDIRPNDENRMKNIYLLSDLINKEGVDPYKFEEFRNALINLNMIEFELQEGDIITFTTDGFLNNCYGLTYSPSGYQPAYNDCGKIVHWEKVGENWYFWYST